MTTLQTSTVTCANCGATDISGRFCPSCGAQVAAAQAPPSAQPQAAGATPPPAPPAQRTRPRWLPAALIGGTVVLVGVVVAVVLLVVGGNPSDPAAKTAAAAPGLRDVTLAAQDVYAPQQGRGFVALLPAGWLPTKTKLTIPFASALVVRSAQDGAATITVGALNTKNGSLAKAAKALQPDLGASAVVTASHTTRFAGARPAWRMNYTADGLTKVAYLFDACDSRYAVVGAATAASFDSVKARFGLVASSLQPVC